MIRYFFIAAIAVVANLGGAAAQSPGTFNQFPQVPPPVPSPGGPPPPVIAPGPAAPPQPLAPSSTIVTVPGAPLVVIPAAPPGRNSFSDRVERCVHYGTAAGVRPNEIGQFTAQCAN